LLNTQDATLTTDASANQAEFWNQSAGSKVFSHPLDHARFERTVARDAAILDYGCGRGRLCGELSASGFGNLFGVDYSTEMIAAARQTWPSLNFAVVDGSAVPLATASVDAALLFAVLTCIPSDAAQRALIAEIVRVLKPGGLLVVSDYPLQTDARNVTRYGASAAEFARYGTFRLVDGGVVRHHAREWFRELLVDFSIDDEIDVQATTMNGNPTQIVQIWVRRR